MSEEMFEQLVAMIGYCTKMSAAALVVGLVCIVGIFVTLMCLVVIDRKINYMRQALGQLPEEQSAKFKLFGKKQGKGAQKHD